MEGITENVPELVRNEDRLVVPQELNFRRFFRQFSVNKNSNFERHTSIRAVYLELDSLRPSDSHIFNILSSPLVASNSRDLFTAAHRTGPGLGLESFSRPSETNVECRTCPVLRANQTFSQTCI